MNMKSNAFRLHSAQRRTPKSLSSGISFLSLDLDNEASQTGLVARSVILVPEFLGGGAV